MAFLLWLPPSSFLFCVSSLGSKPGWFSSLALERKCAQAVFCQIGELNRLTVQLPLVLTRRKEEEEVWDHHPSAEMSCYFNLHCRLSSLVK